MTPKELQAVVDNCKARDCLDPAVPQLSPHVLERAVLALAALVPEVRTVIGTTASGATVHGIGRT